MWGRGTLGGPGEAIVFSCPKTAQDIKHLGQAQHLCLNRPGPTFTQVLCVFCSLSCATKRLPLSFILCAFSSNADLAQSCLPCELDGVKVPWSIKQQADI